MKNNYVKQFFIRGVAFAGLGPIIAGFVYWMIDRNLPDFTLTGWQVFLAVVTTYFLAFVQAGSSVYEQIESWSPAKSALIHLGCIYAAYILTYLVNSWIPFKWEVILIFTAIFVLTFALIWIIVFFITKGTARKLNGKLNA